jgi:hypothetical protein
VGANLPLVKLIATVRELFFAVARLWSRHALSPIWL